MKPKKHIKEMSYIDFGGANYIFRFCEAIEDVYLLHPDGYMAIRGMSEDWIDNELENLMKKLSVDNEDYELEGSTSEWKENTLYIVKLNKQNMNILRTFFFLNPKYYFCAEWISYFKDDEILVDIGHAYDGTQEQLHLNCKLSKDKVKSFEIRRGFCVDWTVIDIECLQT